MKPHPARSLFAAWLLGATPLAVVAQTSAVALRGVTEAQAVSTNEFGLVLGIHAFADGAVLVNDGSSRQLSILDRNLANRRVIFDSTNGAEKYYGRRASPIVSVRDSVFFVDGASSSLLLISSDGYLKGVVAPPKASDLRYIAAGASYFDRKGNFLYRVVAYRPPLGTLSEAEGLALAYGPLEPFPIVRANFDTRNVDTVGFTAAPKDRRVDSRMVGLRPTINVYHHPIFSLDEWAVLSDGTVAFVRGGDYHVDFVRPDGTTLKGAKIPFEFQRITEAEKIALIDSLRRTGPPRRDPLQQPIAGEQRIGLRSPMTSSASSPIVTNDWVNATEVPDYWPPFRQGAVRPDPNNRLWVLPTTSQAVVANSLLYDVIGNDGALKFRVRLPEGRILAGFGADDSLYLIFRNPSGRWQLERRQLEGAR